MSVDIRVARTAALALLLLATALLACKKNEAATAACVGPGKGDSDACEACCKANGANGYKYVGSECSCLGE